MFKNALVSVSDKTGLIDFLNPLIQEGLRVVSTGGTAEYLRQNGIAVVDVSEQTGFPEVMGGRVKTLHPYVHMALLANLDKSEDKDCLTNYKIESFDLVIVNLYPFESALQSPSQFDQLIEKIDVGGPSMLRAAAKNFKFNAVLCDPKDYKWVADKNYALNLQDRQRLAAKVFSQVSFYDSLIAHALSFENGTVRGFQSLPLFEEKSEPEATTLFVTNFSARLKQSLRYGENSQQKAFWLETGGLPFGLSEAKVLQGKELSYNNLLDLDAALGLVLQFDLPGAVAVKHNNPCGAAVDKSFSKALQKALAADPVSVFGGIVACNRQIEKPDAELMSELFLECLVAPSFSPEALQILSKKKNLRLLESDKIFKTSKQWDLKSILGGFLVQQADRFESNIQNWKIESQVSPTEEQKQDMLFGEKVCGYLKSNAIAIVAHGQTLGLGMGQVNRVDAVQQALQRAEKLHWKTSSVKPSECILISDAFFPFPDSVELIARTGIQWVVQPGGSLKDQEVLSAAKKLNLSMAMTGQRHFRH